MIRFYFKFIPVVSLFLSLSVSLFSQNVGINTTGATPNTSAILDLSTGNTGKGFLAPQVSLSSTTDVSTIASPATGLIVYNTNSSITSGSGVGYYYWTGSVWTYLVNSANTTSWQITGNSNITDGTNFIGTTNTVPINFQINGNKAGRIDAINNNTFLGYQSGNATTSSTTGTDNNGIGVEALKSNTSGSQNTAIGDYSGYTTTAANANVSGAANTYVGYNTGPGSTTQYNNATAIGANAVVSQSNSMVLGGITGTNGGTSVSVGIGTATPQAALDITSSTQGILIPRMSSAPSSPVTGLMYYNTTTSCFMIYAGSTWQTVYCPCSAAPASLGAITGSATLCEQTTGYTYSVASVTGATTYTWSSSNTNIATIATGQGTTSITLNTGTTSGTFTLSVSVSNACGTYGTPSTLIISSLIPSIPITLTNSQSAATPTNFQQMITVNSSLYTRFENTGLQNVEFTTGSGGTGTQLQAWIESGASYLSNNTVYWINLGTNTIAASGGTLTIYMNFMNASVLSSSGPTGEAPTLTPTYAQYDNGSSVFIQYFNMSTDPISVSYRGTSNWTATTGTGPTGTTQDLLKYTASSGGEIAGLTNASSTFPSSFIIDTWVESCIVGYDIGIGAITSTSTNTGYMADPGSYANADFGLYKITALNSTSNLSIPANILTLGAWYFIEYQYISGGTLNGYLQPWTNSLIGSAGYTSKVTSTDATYTSFQSIALIPSVNSTSNSPYWALIAVRAYPPSNVMPTYSFGSETCY